MRIIALIAACMTLLPGAGRAWWEAGHIIVAEIAHERLTPKAQAECDRLCAVAIEPAPAMEHTANFKMASVWADDVKRHFGNGPWHYYDIPFSDDGTSLALHNDPMNIITALEQNSAILRDASAGDAEKAAALRYVIHFMGDIHQPLHCSARCTKAHPGGDQGGNKFHLTGVEGIKNLHYLWDSGMRKEMSGYVNRPLSDEETAAFDALAKQFVSDNPLDPAMLQYDGFMALCEESFQVARSAAYEGVEEDETPPEAYLERGRAVVGRQLALGGYRLADLLNSIFDPAPPVAQ